MFISPISSQNKGFNPTYKSLTPLQQQTMDLQVFYHHIYEYKKGLRNLVLTTEKQEHRAHIEDRLKGNKIDYVIQDVNPQKINVFFGAKDCVEVVKTFIDKRLNKLSPEQDFILGIMLGYDRLKQCARYLDFKNKNSK
jgi:hypothetical protein